jgi:hypothetical protein
LSVRFALGATLLLGALLAGCAPTSAGSEAQFNPCLQFEGASIPLLNSFTDAPLRSWAEELEEVRRIADTAEGDVRAAILAFVDQSPPEAEIATDSEAQRRVNELLAAVAAACAADGAPIGPNVFVITG